MLIPYIAWAQSSAESSQAGILLKKVVAVIVNPIIILFFIIALAVFVYGMFEFIRGADNEEARKKGQEHMKWGIIGLFIMTAAFALITILSNLVGNFGAEPDFWIIK